MRDYSYLESQPGDTPEQLIEKARLVQQMVAFEKSEAESELSEDAITTLISLVGALVLGIAGVSDGSVHADTPEIFTGISTLVASYLTIKHGITNMSSAISTLVKEQITSLGIRLD